MAMDLENTGKRVSFMTGAFAPVHEGVCFVLGSWHLTFHMCSHAGANLMVFGVSCLLLDSAEHLF